MPGGDFATIRIRPVLLFCADDLATGEPTDEAETEAKDGDSRGNGDKTLMMQANVMYKQLTNNLMCKQRRNMNK